MKATIVLNNGLTLETLQPGAYYLLRTKDLISSMDSVFVFLGLKDGVPEFAPCFITSEPEEEQEAFMDANFYNNEHLHMTIECQMVPAEGAKQA